MSDYSLEELDELARLFKSAARHRPQDIENMKAQAVAALGEERLAPASDEGAALKARLKSCTAVHRLVHAQPFHDDQAQLRSDQWREVLQRFIDLKDAELTDWLALQIEVAQNIERGIPDTRPRKDGPTFLILLEFVANQKRKALAILHWFDGAQA